MLWLFIKVNVYYKLKGTSNLERVQQYTLYVALHNQKLGHFPHTPLLRTLATTDTKKTVSRVAAITRVDCTYFKSIYIGLKLSSYQIPARTLNTLWSKVLFFLQRRRIEIPPPLSNKLPITAITADFRYSFYNPVWREVLWAERILPRNTR